MKAALYARVSTERQEFETQARILRDLCASKGWPIMEEYTEEVVACAVLFLEGG